MIPALVAFNLQPVEYAHRSWLVNLPLPVERLATASTGDTAIKRAMNAWMLESADLTGKHEWDFSAPHRRFLLAEPPELQKIAIAVGVSAYRATLRLQLEVPGAWSPQRYLGADLYSKALAFGRLSACVGIHAESKGEADESCPLTMEEVYEAGIALVVGVCSEGRPELMKRAIWKFPMALQPKQEMALDQYAKRAVLDLVSALFRSDPVTSCLS